VPPHVSVFGRIVYSVLSADAMNISQRCFRVVRGNPCLLLCFGSHLSAFPVGLVSCTRRDPAVEDDGGWSQSQSWFNRRL